MALHFPSVSGRQEGVRAITHAAETILGEEVRVLLSGPWMRWIRWSFLRLVWFSFFVCRDYRRYRPIRQTHSIWVSIDSEFHGISFDMRLDILSTEWSRKIPASYFWLLKSQSASFFLSIHMRNTFSFWRNFGVSARFCVHWRLCLCPLVHGCCQFGLRLFGWSVSRLDAWVQTMISQAPVEMREKETVRENDL